EVGRVDAVAEALVHGAALAVHGPAVAEAALIRGLALRRNADEQGGLEPAAELVAALEVHLRGPAAGAVELHGRDVRAAGVEPAVERIRLFGEMHAAAVRA